jgi:hypothetical protein
VVTLFKEVPEVAGANEGGGVGEAGFACAVFDAEGVPTAPEACV